MHILDLNQLYYTSKEQKNKMHIIISIGPVCLDLSVQKDCSDVDGCLKIRSITLSYFALSACVPPAYKKYMTPLD